jgi:EKC/KEOPS complex subunit CGI121/TPRKB
METITLPHFPDHSLHLVLFTDVQNPAFLRQQLLAGNTEYEYAFLDASVLLSRNHVLSACFRSVNDMLAERLKSRNVHSEIVFAMSPNNNVSVRAHQVINHCVQASG